VPCETFTDNLTIQDIRRLEGAHAKITAIPFGAQQLESWEGTLFTCTRTSFMVGKEIVHIKSVTKLEVMHTWPRIK
jgi:hypothetical protein